LICELEYLILVTKILAIKKLTCKLASSLKLKTNLESIVINN